MTAKHRVAFLWDGKKLYYMGEELNAYRGFFISKEFILPSQEGKKDTLIIKHIVKPDEETDPEESHVIDVRYFKWKPGKGFEAISN